jgi:hypothetical protein
MARGWLQAFHGQSGGTLTVTGKNKRFEFRDRSVAGRNNVNGFVFTEKCGFDAF